MASPPAAVKPLCSSPPEKSVNVSKAVLWARRLSVLHAVGHPSVCPSGLDGRLSVAAHQAPSSAGALADHRARQSRGRAAPAQWPAAPPRPAAVRSAADVRGFRSWRGRPTNRGQLCADRPDRRLTSRPHHDALRSGGTQFLRKYSYLYHYEDLYCYADRAKSTTKALFDKPTAEIVRIISIIHHFGCERVHPPVNRSCSYASTSCYATSMSRALYIESCSRNRLYDLNDNNNFVLYQ